MKIKLAAGIAGVIASVIYISDHNVPKTIKNKNEGLERIKAQAEYAEFGTQTIDTFSTKTRTADTLSYSNKYIAAFKDISENLVNIFRKSIEKIK